MDEFPALPVEEPDGSDPRSPTPQAQEHVDDAGPTASELEPKLVRHQIGKYGDLKLRVGTNRELEDENIEAVEYLVDSRAVEITAPAFYQKLNKLWRESRKPLDNSRTWTVELPDDDPAAMCVVLNIMHGRMSFVPRHIDMDELFDVCVLAHKHELVHLLRPRVVSWNFRAYHNAVQGIWISWVLGNRDRFASCCGSALMRSRLEEDDGKEFLVLDSDSYSDPAYVESICIAGQLDLVEYIADKRVEVLDVLFSSIREVYGRLLENDPSLPDPSRNMERLWLLACGLERANMFNPIPSASDWKGSVESLIAAIYSVFGTPKLYRLVPQTAIDEVHEVSWDFPLPQYFELCLCDARRRLDGLEQVRAFPLRCH